MTIQQQNDAIAERLLQEAEEAQDSRDYAEWQLIQLARELGHANAIRLIQSDKEN